MAETLAFLHAVSPRVVVPIHTGLLNEQGLAGYLMHVERFGPDGCELVDLRPDRRTTSERQPCSRR